MKKIASVLKKTKKTILAIFLSTNLILLSTGSAELNLASPSADLNDQTSPSASEEQSTPSVQTRGTKTSESQVSRTFKLDPTGTFVEDELVVKFKKGLPQRAKEGILSLQQSEIIKEYPRTEVTLIQVEPDKREKIINTLSSNPNVEYVHENQIGRFQDGFGGGGGLPSPPCVPNDYLYCLFIQWGLNKIRASDGWGYNRGSSSTKIAVVDSGVDYNHYDLGLSSGGGKVIKGADIRADDGDPMDEDENGIGHGTLVAGIIAAKTNNASGMAGVNWYGKIIAIRVGSPLEPPFETEVAEGIMDALARGAQVINLSVALQNDNLTLNNAILAALGSNVIVVAAVDNSYQTNCFMGFPALYWGVVSVAATDGSDNYTSGCTTDSANGTTYQGIQLTAPGKDIYTLRINNGLGKYSGTSYAAAFVSGVASILVSCTDPTTAKFDLILGSDDLGSFGYDETYGHGRVNLYKSLTRNCY